MRVGSLTRSSISFAPVTAARLDSMHRESQLLPQHASFRQIIPAGDYWIETIKKDQVLRIVDVEGNQAADTLFFNADDVSDRYSAVDTIREQGNVYLSCGSKLLSTSGQVLAR